MAGLMQRYFARLSRNSFLLAAASLFADISTEMLYPVLPVFLTQTLKASGSIVGLVDGFAQAAQNIVQGFSGALSDKLQRRKPIAIVGYFLAAIAKPLMGLATVWPELFGARLLDRVGAGTRSAPRDALIASSVDEENRGRAFGLEGVGDNAGAFLGPLLAALLLYAAHVDLRTIFYLAVVPGLLALLMVLLVKERRVLFSAKSKIDISLGRFPKEYWRYLLATALFGIGNSSNAFLILRTQDIGASLEMTILIYAGFNLVAALISYPAGSLSDQWGRRNLLLASFVIFLIAYLGFALTQNILVIAGLFVFYGVFQGIFRAVGKAFASDFVADKLRASAVGWYSTSVGLLDLVASVVAGLLWDRIGHVAVFYYGALFALIGSIGLLLIVPGNPDRPK
jgi:MFS family permease